MAPSQQMMQTKLKFKPTTLKLYSHVRDNNVQYQLNGEHLRSVSHQRDLGVIVDETLKPHRQCAKAANSASSIMRAIKASFMNITPTLFDKLYGFFYALTWNTHSKPGGRG